MLLACAISLTTASASPQQPSSAPASPPDGTVPGFDPSAAAAAATEKLPSVDEVVRRHVDAVGGEAAIRSSRHLTWKGTFAMPGMGLEGTLTLHTSAPNLFHLVIDAPGVGVIPQGFDGTVGWSDNPMTGPTVITGGELELLALQSDFYSELDTEKLYAKREVIGRETYAGEPCWKVAMTTPGGIEMNNYFSIATGLMVGSSGNLPTPMGKVFAESQIGGYKKFGDRLYPTETRQKAMGAEQVLTMTEADFSPIDPAVYALPEAIKTLVAAQPAG